jgi:hypothetical protein
MMDLKKYRDLLVCRQSQLRADLADLERGDLQIALRQTSTEEWMDATKVMSQHYKHQIELCNRMIAMLDETLSKLGSFAGQNEMRP